MDAVAPGLGAEQDDEITLPLRPRADEVISPDQPDAHRVDEGIARVGWRELDLPADCRYPDGVSVASDAAHDLSKQIAVALLV